MVLFFHKFFPFHGYERDHAWLEACDNCRIFCLHHTYGCSAGAMRVGRCVLLVVTFLTIVLASKQFGFAYFRFISSFQQAHPLPPVNFSIGSGLWIRLRSIKFCLGSTKGVSFLPRGKFGVDRFSCFPGRVQVDCGSAQHRIGRFWVVVRTACCSMLTALPHPSKLHLKAIWHSQKWRKRS